MRVQKNCLANFFYKVKQKQVMRICHAGRQHTHTQLLQRAMLVLREEIKKKHVQ
jgi:hypothetical protein